jgi:hypothetical protein
VICLNIALGIGVAEAEVSAVYTREYWFGYSCLPSTGGGFGQPASDGTPTVQFVGDPPGIADGWKIRPWMRPINILGLTWAQVGPVNSPIYYLTFGNTIAGNLIGVWGYGSTGGNYQYTPGRGIKVPASPPANEEDEYIDIRGACPVGGSGNIIVNFEYEPAQ